MSETEFASLDMHICEMETAFIHTEDGADSSIDVQHARACLGSAIKMACALPNDKTTYIFSNLLERAASAGSGRRESAILVLRALAIDGLLPFESDHQLERRVLELGPVHTI
jgi:hypothetical protein